MACNRAIAVAGYSGMGYYEYNQSQPNKLSQQIGKKYGSRLAYGVKSAGQRCGQENHRTYNTHKSDLSGYMSIVKNNSAKA